MDLVLDFQKKKLSPQKIGVFHQDFEAQYTVTTEYVERTFEKIHKDVEPYWVCLPMATRTALGSYEMYWYPWDDTKEDAWVRPMPDHPYVINLKIIRLQLTTIVCIRRISPNNLVDGIVSPMTIKNHLPAWYPRGRIHAALQRYFKSEIWLW